MEKLLWITLALSITACTGSTPFQSISHIPAETTITSKAVVIPLDEISKEINYIPLETKDESLVKEVRSFIFDKNHIYINDAERQCLKFARDGKFVCRIGSKGNGPNEYLHVTEVFLHDDKIHIYDAYSLSVLTYQLSGEFISRTALNGYLAGHMFVEMLPNGHMVTFTPDKGLSPKSPMLTFAQLSMQGSDVTIVDSIPHPNPLTEAGDVSWYFKEAQFAQKGKEQLFKCTFNDTLYSITEKEGKYTILPKYIFDLGPYAAIGDARAQTYKSFRSPQAFDPFKTMARIELLGESKQYVFYSANDEPAYFFDKDNGMVNKWLFFIKGKEKECEENPKFYTPIEIDSTGNLLGIMPADNEEDNPVLVIAELE